jgi:hypothetical protein
VVLSCPGPIKYAKTGVYLYRRRVPDRLRALVGKREEKRSLGTKDPVEAKRRHAEIHADVEAKWQALESRAGIEAAKERIELSHKQLVALAGEVYRDTVARHEDEPGDPSRWEALARPASIETLDVQRPEAGLTGESPVVARLRYALRRRLAAEGLEVDSNALQKAAQLASKAAVAAAMRLRRAAEGDYTPDAVAASFPAWASPKRSARIGEIWGAYVAEAKPAPNTVKRWKPVLDRFRGHLGHDDLANVTADDVIGWKESLIQSGLDNETIRKVHLAALKRVCTFAVANRRIAANPAEAVTIAKTKKVKLREQGFTLAEARLILSKTTKPVGPRTSKHHAAARRWVPWLCAYTGARVNEITQACGRHVKAVETPGGEPVWMLTITPEAGNQKGYEARDVPLHPHLIEQGFLEFVSRCGKGPLFYDPSSSRGGRDPAYAQMGSKLAKWVREVGVKDPTIDPNHAWRHRFRSVARDVGMPEGICDRILGHAPATVGQRYGDLWPGVALREVSKVPPYPSPN